MNKTQITLEQEFKLAVLKREVKRLSLGQMQSLIVELSRQLIARENMLRLMRKTNG